MSGCGCEYCKDLCQEWRIVTPGDLSQAIGVVKDNLKDGTIIASTYWPEPILRVDCEPIAEVPDKGPWPDVMIYYFQCRKCGQLFRLSVETYHGSGGEWRPEDKGKP